MVYIKNQQNPLLYKQPTKVEATSNQPTFRKNYLQEFIKNQQTMNGELKNASNSLDSLLHQTKHEQQKHFHQLTKQLVDQENRTIPLLENINKQEEANELFFRKFTAIDSFNKDILKKYEEEGLINQAIIDQLTLQDTAMNQLANKIDQFKEQHSNVNKQLVSQKEINDQILKTIEIQETFHKTILDRIDQQEAINLKTSRELDSLRSTIFERISFVVEKIEENYRQITGYFAQFFNRSVSTRNNDNQSSDKKEKETTISR
ncbi:hypothetical protein [Metabacillus niabensis]|uniref:hypothetical protein n=1 Tax=Metabacillus niabensis TaxID=324854 RepID=UPI001CF9F082|nr:hypothetical protein [Metabacillus niabensis]